jgi:tetratricopeptide (TPR) repeat protein
MLDVMEANELLEQAEILYRCGSFSELVSMLEQVPEDVLFQQRELGWYLTRAHIRLGQHFDALSVIERLTITVIPTVNDRTFRRCVNLNAVLLIFRGDIDRAEDMLLELLNLCQNSDDQWTLAEATVNLGVVADIRTNWNNAIAAYRRALIPFEKLGDVIGMAHCHHNMAMSLRQIGRYERSSANFDLALELYRRASNEQLALACESERALLAVRMGDLYFAECTARRALERSRTLKYHYVDGELLRVLGIILAPTGSAEARACFDQALDVARDVGALMLQAEVFEELALFELSWGHDRTTAQDYLANAMKLFIEVGTTARAELARQRVDFALGVAG